MHWIALTAQHTRRVTSPVAGCLRVLGLWAAAGKTAPRQPAAHS